MASDDTEQALEQVRFLTVAEVAQIMRVSKMTVYRLVHAGDLPAVRVGALSGAGEGRPRLFAAFFHRGRLIRRRSSMTRHPSGDPRTASARSLWGSEVLDLLKG